MREIFVERIIEPYVGMPLLGVGGFRNCQRIFVHYDDQVAAILTPDSVDGHFSTQLPLEKISRVRVLDDRDTLLFDAELSSIRERGATTTPKGPIARTLHSILTGQVLSPWRWLARADRFSEKLLQAKQKLRRKLTHPRPRSPHDAAITRTVDGPVPNTGPTISILMPVYEVEPRWFRAAVQSVMNQSYERWELCIADDCSTRVDLLAEFDRLPADNRIKYVRRSSNGHICHASNSAAGLATGEFVALLDHDDALAPHALAEVANALARDPAADLVYSDEDKIDAKNRRYDPQHKPDWSPELLLSYNYINHFTVLRRSLFERVGRFRPGYEGSQDHDLLLRASEHTRRIVHVPKILYHWRSLPTSTASTAGVKTYVHTSGRRAVEYALNRRGIDATLAVPAFASRLGLPVLALERGEGTVAVIEHDGNAATLNRLAADRSEDYLLFIRKDLKAKDPHWLGRLLAYARIPGVGAVGGRLGSAAGTVITEDGPVQAFESLSPEAISYYFYAEVARNVAAPSMGLLLTRRDMFESVGGFDPRFPTLFELDYATRLAARNLRSVHVGDAAFEPVPALSVDPLEWQTFRTLHGTHDPYSNPNFDPPFVVSGDAGLIPCTPAQPLKTLVAAHNLNSPEGAPRYLSEIVLGLRDRGAMKPVVLSPLGGAGAAVYRDADVPVSILDAPWARRFVDAQWTPRAYEAAQQVLMAELRRTQPDVVLANTLLMFPIVEAAARLGIPSVWIIHESYSHAVLSRLFTPYAQARCEGAFALASRIVPASHETADIFRRCDVRHNIRVIHNGIDPDPIDRYCREVSREAARQSLRLDARSTHIVSVGTVCERKGQHALVEAAAILKRTRSDFAIHIVGLRDAVPYSGYMRQLVTRRGVESVVNLVEETPEVFAWFRAADVFACTSHMETFSRSILEAEIFGLPIVSTPCHGLDEQVIWNQNALQFPFHDAQALSEQLAVLIDDAALRVQMGRKSRAAFDNHATLGTMLDRYQAVLQQTTGTLRSESPMPASQRRAA